MGITDSFLNKVEKKTNVSKQTILDLADRLKGGNLKDESTIRGVIDELAKLTGKNVSKEQSDKIVKAVVGDQIPKIYFFFFSYLHISYIIFNEIEKKVGIIWKNTIS